MSENDLLNQGIEAARAGDRDKARKLFEEVLEKNDQNIKAWMLLYRVVDDENEKRICLTTVLQLDPSNQKAREALEKLDAKAQKSKADEEVIPGITRRQLTMMLAAGGGVIGVILLIVIVIGIARGNQAAAEQRAILAVTQTHDAQLAEQTRIMAELTQEVTNAAATAFAQASPTPTATHTRSAGDLPPTWTLTPEPTQAVRATPLPQPQGIPGAITAWSGVDIANNDYLPIMIFPLAGAGQGQRVGEFTGRYPSISPDGTQVIYTKWSPTTFSYGIERINRTGTSTEDLASRWVGVISMLKPEMASYSVNGDQVVFVGVPVGSETTQVFLLNLNVERAIQQLTNDAATYTFPALSPDGTKVVAVRNDTTSTSPGEDLVVIDVTTQTQRALTVDFGSFVESSPRWSLDGTKIIYAAYPSTEPTNADIIMVNADGTGVPTLPVRSAGNDVYPVISPDGRYIAFSSNRSGAYDIYVYEIATGNLWQLTDTEVEDYPFGWTYN
jgi:dipeptidyl aminopeptidase/acylaminoacyl peptidase